MPGDFPGWKEKPSSFIKKLIKQREPRKASLCICVSLCPFSALFHGNFPQNFSIFIVSHPGQRCHDNLSKDVMIIYLRQVTALTEIDEFFMKFDDFRASLTAA